MNIKAGISFSTCVASASWRMYYRTYANSQDLIDIQNSFSNFGQHEHVTI